jgi:hypothetical protein
VTDAEKQAELAALKQDYASVRLAIRAVLGGAASYTLDTGQSKQTVTRANITELQKLMAWLRDEIERLERELGLGPGAGKQIYVRPGF